jgi:threonine/homoserine/homoserine lactone efflux protein
MHPFVIGVIAGFGIAIPVGAIAILIVQVGIRCGFWCAASAGAGAASADLVYAVLAVTGGAALASTVESIGEPFRWLSAAVLAAMAIHGLLSARRRPVSVEATLPRPREYLTTYARFLGLTILNPLTIAYFAAIVVGLGLAEGLQGGDAVVFVAGAFLASLSWQTLLAAVGAVARHRLPSRVAVATTVVGNTIVLAIAAFIVLR